MAYKARPLIVRFNEKYYVEPGTTIWRIKAGKTWAHL